MRISLSDKPVRDKWEDVLRLYPWYADLKAASEIKQWEDIPFLTHERLLPYYERGEGANYPDWNVYRTSGTSGSKRKAIYYDMMDEVAYVQHKTALFDKLLDGWNVQRALSDVGTGHAEATAPRIFEELGLECDSIPFGLPVAAHLLHLSAFKPDVLYTMPSILDGLIRVAPADYEWGLSCVILVGEPASPAWRQRMGERLGIDASAIMDTYGSIEVGTIAYWDQARGRYVMLDGLLGEGASPDEVGLTNMQLAAGEQILVLTSLVRRRFPVLRFVTYDVVRDLQIEEVEGQMVTTFAAIVKRVGPELKHGEKISVFDIENAVFKHLQQAAVKVLVSGNRLEVQITIPDSIAPSAAAKIRNEVHGAIPEIGAMIRGGLLGEIKVTFINDNEAAGSADSAQAGAAPIKKKKLYIQDSAEKEEPS